LATNFDIVHTTLVPTTFHGLRERTSTAWSLGDSDNLADVLASDGSRRTTMSIHSCQAGSKGRSDRYWRCFHQGISPAI